MVLLRRVLVFLLMGAGLQVVQGRAQSPLSYPYDIDIVPARGILPTADYVSDGVGTVEVTTGKLFFEIPLASMPPGRAGSGFTLSLNYDSHLYNMAPVWDGEILRTIYPHSPPAGGAPGGWRYNIQSIGPRVDTRRLNNGSCASATDRRQYIAWFVLPDGSPHLLHLRGAGDERIDNYVGDGFYDTAITGYSQCGASQNGGVLTYYTADGTFLKFEVDATGNHSLPYTSWNYPAAGQRWTLYYPDGRRIEGNGRKTTALIDANGNRLSVANHFGELNAYTSITDDFGRTMRIDFQNGYDVITAPSGATWIVYWTGVAPAGTNRFYWCGIEADCSIDLGGLGVVSGIVLPAVNGVNRYWAFGYSGANPGEFGELNRIITPEGADYRYAYAIQQGYEEPFAEVLLGYNGVVAGQIAHDGAVDSWGVNYLRGGSGAVSTRVIGPDQGVTTYTYAKPWEVQNPLRGLVTDIASSAGVGVSREWAQNRAYGLRGGQNVSPNNPFVYREREVVQGSSLLSALTESVYDKNGNLLRSRQYDWVEGVSGAGGLLREVQRTYAVGVGESGDTSDNANAYWGSRGPQGCSGDGVLRLDALQREVVRGTGDPVAATEFGYANTGASCPLTNGNVAEIRQWDSVRAPALPAGPLSSGSAIIVAREFNVFGDVTQILTPPSSAGGNPLKTTFAYDPIAGSAGPGPYATRVIHGKGLAAPRSSTQGWERLTGARTVAIDEQSQAATSATYFDPFQRPTDIYDPGRHTGIRYDDGVRQVVVTEDPLNPGDPARTTLLSRDQLGRPVLTQAPDGAPINTENDGVKVRTRYAVTPGVGARVITSSPHRDPDTDATLEWTCVQYDTLGRAVAIGLSTGPAAPPDCESWAIGVTRIYYGTGLLADGRRTSWSQTNDPAGRVREEYRDATGNLIQVVDHPDIFTSDITRYTYDAVGNLRTVSQGAQTRSFDYTSLGRLSRAFNPETGDIAYEYYDSGNLKSRRDGRPAVTEYAYDGLGRLVNKTYSGVGAGGAPAVTYAYGQSGPNAGRLTSVSTSSGTQSYTYDLLGRVISNTQTIAGAGAYTFSYDYWPNDVLKSIRYPSGKLVQYGVDSAGRVNKASAADVVYADLTEAPGPGPAPAFYSPDGRIALMKLGNGLWETHDFRAPDPGNPARLMLGATAGSGDRVQLEYQYLTPGEPWDGNLKAATIRRNGRAWQQHYFYDALDRIDCVIEAPDRPAGCDAPGMWSETFGYDRYGNRWVTSSSQQNRDAAHEPRFASDFDPATNRLTDARLAGVQYDDAGNLTGLTPRTLVYDAENRLVAVKLTATGDTLGTFVYDGEGRRIARTWLGATTYYLYNINGQVAVEYSTIAYPESSRSYVFTDMLGSVRAISSENGAVTECHDYLPFGEELSSADGAPGNTRDLPCFGAASVLSQKFTGQQRDSETGLDYFIARYMSPVQGRFTSPDTPFADQHVADPQTWNLYEYARNNPISNVDPSGQAYFVCNLKGECYRREIQSVWWIGQGEVRFANGEIFARRKATGDFTLLVGTYTWAPDGDIYPTLADPIALLAGGMVRKSGTFLAASFATRTAAADASGAALGLAADSTTSLEYVLQKVETLDFSTASNKAVFYSGPGQWARATAFAERTGKTTIEMTSGGRELAADSVFQSLSPAEQFQVWQRASTPFAKGASGEVHAFIRGARPDRTFRTIEEKLLDANANVHRYIYHY